MATRLRRPALWPLLFSLLAALGCLLLYRCDNKYTMDGPQGSNGALLLGEADLEKHPVVFLVRGWAYYGGQLLTPADFEADPPTPDRTIYIGQYGGFEAGAFSASPHGSATYRLTIGLLEESRRYTLELPEVFSAYRLYINGEPVFSMGEPDPATYRAETGNRVVTFEAAGSADLLLAVSDFSHLYSGMVYPPAFGEPEAVAALLARRFLLRAVVCAAAATVGLLSLLVGLLTKNRLTLLFSLLCLLFLGYGGYPMWLTIGTGSRLTYVLENLCFCGLLLTAMLIQRGIFGRPERMRDRSIPFLIFGAITCAATVAAHLALPSGNLWMMTAYSLLVMAYQWVTAAWLTVSAIRVARRGPIRAPVILCGALALDAALVMDRLLPDYEPILGGWFTELAAALLVLFIGVVIGQEVADQYRANAVLEERTRGAERLLEVQKTYYATLRDQFEEIRGLQHNQRHHFLALEGMVKQRRYEELEAYLRAYGSVLPDNTVLRYCDNEVVNLFAHTYSRLAEQSGVRLSLVLEVEEALLVSPADLSALLGNLLENALEACCRAASAEKEIRLSINRRGSVLAILLENSAAGIVPDRDGFFSSKAVGRRGYGLETVRVIAAKYGGDAGFRFDEEKSVFFSTVTLMV